MASTSTDRRLGLTGSAAIKVPCAAATTANTTLSGEQTVDGVSCVTGDRVLVKNQTSSVDNGIYVVDTGTWTRDLDFDGANDVTTGTIVMVLNGSVNANTYWRVTTTGDITFGSSSISFAAALAGDSASVAFLPSGTGAVSTTLQAKERERASLFDFLSAAQKIDVAAGTGSIDVSTAVQAAFDSGYPLYANPGKYKISSLRSIPAMLDLKGDWKFAKTGNTAHAVFAIDAGVVGFQTPSTSGAESLGISIEGVVFTGGTTQLDVRNGGVGLTLKHVQFSGPSSKCLATAGFCQEWFFEDVEFNGGEYGFYMPNASGSAGSSSLFDKSVMRRVYAHGQTINGIVTKPTLSNNVLWEQPSLVTITQDGWLIDGGIRDWVIINTNTESNGYLGSAPTAATTGSITSGTPTLVVASATGLAIGQTLTVEGAGANGADLYSLIDNLVGTTVTLHDNASTTVASLEVTKYTYSDIKFTAAVAAPANIKFIGGVFGVTSSLGGQRYGIDCAGASGITLIGVRNNRPIYDPSRIVTLLEGSSATVRSPRNFLTESFGTTILGQTTYRNQVGSPNGGNFVLGMRDSAGNGSGTYGLFEVRKFDPNRTRIAYIDGTVGDIAAAKRIMPGDFGAGTGASVGIGSTGIVFGQAAPTAGTWVQGDTVLKTNATVGQPIGWRCTVSGTPGTWVAMANL